jgi:hypothetical protein
MWRSVALEGSVSKLEMARLRWAREYRDAVIAHDAKRLFVAYKLGSIFTQKIVVLEALRYTLRWNCPTERDFARKGAPDRAVLSELRARIAAIQQTDFPREMT